MADVTECSPVPADNEGQGTASEIPGATSASAVQQREERHKILRERQNEERQKKLEELKQQAVATQRFREQQEEERRRRMEEQRQRDFERRTQVEERKKAILEAEKDRREALLRRNQDRDIRLELKRRNERGSMAFAFGSSTPRMLEPVESLATYWGSRRATSTTNVMSTSVHGRSATTSSNGNNSSGTKKASSVFGLDQNEEDMMTQSTSTVLPGPILDGRRRRTDLMPTIPIHRENLSATSPRSSSARGSVSRTTGLRSGDVTPSSPTRPLSAMSQVSSASTTVATSGYHVRARTAPSSARKPRPVSIAGTGMTVVETNRKLSRENISRERSKETKEKENENEKEKTASNKAASSNGSRPPRARSADVRKDNNNAPSKLKVPVSSDKVPSPSKGPKSKSTNTIDKSPPPQKILPISKGAKVSKAAKCQEENSSPELPTPTDSCNTPTPVVNSHETFETVTIKTEETIVHLYQEETISVEGDVNQMMADIQLETPAIDLEVVAGDEKFIHEEQLPEIAITPREEPSPPGDDSMSEVSQGDGSSLGSKKIISSEEEAKAALAEKRRLAREQMEREAERERLRLEEEKRLEEERRLQEELEQLRAEEEMERLAQEARQAEQERLQKAIEEAQRREEEERLRREEEARQKAEKEAMERKAREEAERMRKENEERLRREEEERQERRKRVEAIMSRTRGKSGPATNNKPNESNQVPPSNDLNSSQPDLLGDLVNKDTSNGQTNEQTNGFHDKATTPSVLPDISVIANADNVNSNTNVNIEENVEA